MLLNNQLADLREENGTLKSNLASSEMRRESQTAQVTQMTQDIQGCREQLVTNSGELNVLRTQTQQLESNISKLRSELDASNQERLRIQDENNRLQKSDAHAAAQIRELEDKLSTSQVSLTSAAEERQKYIAEANEELQLAKQQAGDNYTAAKEELKQKLEGRINALEQRRTETETELKTIEEEKQKLLDQNSSYMAGINKLQADIVEYKKQIAHLQSQIPSYDELQKRQEELANRSNELQALQAQITSYEQQTIQHNSDLQQLQKGIPTQEAVDLRESELRSAQCKYTELRTCFESMQLEYAQICESDRRSLAEAIRQLDHVDVLAKSKEFVEARNAELQKKHSKLTDAIVRCLNHGGLLAQGQSLDDWLESFMLKDQRALLSRPPNAAYTGQQFLSTSNSIAHVESHRKSFEMTRQGQWPSNSHRVAARHVHLETHQGASPVPVLTDEQAPRASIPGSTGSRAGPQSMSVGIAFEASAARVQTPDNAPTSSASENPKTPANLVIASASSASRSIGHTTRSGSLRLANRKSSALSHQYKPIAQSSGLARYATVHAAEQGSQELDRSVHQPIAQFPEILDTQNECDEVDQVNKFIPEEAMRTIRTSDTDLRSQKQTKPETNRGYVAHEFSDGFDELAGIEHPKAKAVSSKYMQRTKSHLIPSLDEGRKPEAYTPKKSIPKSGSVQPLKSAMKRTRSSTAVLDNADNGLYMRNRVPVREVPSSSQALESKARSRGVNKTMIAASRETAYKRVVKGQAPKSAPLSTTVIGLRETPLQRRPSVAIEDSSPFINPPKRGGLMKRKASEISDAGLDTASKFKEPRLSLPRKPSRTVVPGSQEALGPSLR